MKKLSKVFLSLALVLVMALPMLTMSGCDWFNSNSAKKILEIDLVGEIQTQYVLGESFNANNAKIKIIYEDDTTKQISLDKSMTDFNSSTIGKKDLTITYEGKVKTIEYRVDAIKLGKFNLIKQEYYNGLSKVHTVTPNDTHQGIAYSFNADGTGKVTLTNLIDTTQKTEYNITWSYADNQTISFTQHDGLEQSGEFVIINTQTIHVINQSQNKQTIGSIEFNKIIMILEFED